MKISVNGQERDFEVSGSLLGDLLKEVRAAYSTPSSCISSVRIDGIEVAINDGGDFSVVPISEIREVEVFTAHPRELAEETLQNLRAFGEQLEDLSRRVAEGLDSGQSQTAEFTKLMDGLQMFVEALDGVKQLLGLRHKGISPVLEADLLSILKDLLSYYQLGQKDYVAELLREHVPQNLEEWRTKTIPALIRSRDS